MRLKNILFIYYFFYLAFHSYSQVKEIKLPIRGYFTKEISEYGKNKNILIKRVTGENYKVPNLVIAKEFKLENLVIEKNSSFSMTILNKMSVPSPIYFQDIASFRSSIIWNAGFLMSRFYKKSDFWSATFINNAYFFGVSFVGESIFSSSKFEKDGNFESCFFNDIGNFNNVEVKGKLNFSKSIFKKDMNLTSSKLLNINEFSECSIYSLFNLSSADIGLVTSFNDSKGNGKILLTDCILPYILEYKNIDSLNIDFRETKVDSLKNASNFYVKRGNENRISLIISNSFKADTINYFSLREFELDSSLFSLSKKIKKCIIKLKGSNLENIIIPYDRFWADTTGYTFEEKTALYEKLIKKCVDEGMDASVQGWDIELQKIQILHKWKNWGGGISNFISWFQEIFWNYGYSKWLILVWIIGAYIFFFLLNLFFFYPRLLRVYFMPKIGNDLFITKQNNVETIIKELKSNLSLRIRYILHYTGIIFFGLKLEHSDLSFKNLVSVAILYLEFIIGLVLIGFTLNFVLS